MDVIKINDDDDDHVNETMARAKHWAAIIHCCFLSRNINNLVSAFKTYMYPLLEYAIQIWSLYQKSSINAVESMQRAFTKRSSGLADLSYIERIVNLHLQSLEHRCLWSDLSMCFNTVHGFTALQVADFFYVFDHIHRTWPLVQISCTSIQK